MVNYLNNTKLHNKGKAEVARQKKIEAIGDNKTFMQTQNRSKQIVNVQTLKSRVKDEKEVYKLTVKHMPTYIDNLLWKTSSGFLVSNLPKANDYAFKRLNFAFGKTAVDIKNNYDQMVSAKKVVISYYTHQFEKNGITYNILKIYSIAPSLASTNLPTIYRTDVITNKDNSKFFGVKCLAVVGGCVDGDCPLFQVNTNNKTSGRLYKIKSEQTFRDVDADDDVTNCNYEVTEIDGVTDLDSAVQFAFQKFGVESALEKGQFAHGKIDEMLTILSKKNRPNLVTLNPTEYVKYIFNNETKENWDNINQFVHNLDGTVQNTAKSNKEKKQKPKDEKYFGYN